MRVHIDNEYNRRGKPYVTGEMNRKFSKALGNQCQCDGNCKCGYVQHHRLHCGNCGWNTSYSYDALTDKFVCPSCKTESCININKSDINMSNYIDPSAESPYADPSGESPFSQGVVGTGVGMDGLLLWNKNPLGSSNYVPKKKTQSDVVKDRPKESSFSQNTVSYAIGEQGLSLDPFSNKPISSYESSFDQNTVAYAIGEQGMALQPFQEAQSEENGMLGLGLLGGLALRKDLYCGKYCKSLGYFRKLDKFPFKKCKAACKVNFKDAKKKKWKYPPAPEGMEDNLSPDDIEKDVELQVGKLSSAELQKQEAAAKQEENQELAALRAEMANMRAGQQGTQQGGSKNMMMYIIIGVVVLALIIATIIILKKKKAA